jgi:hypothetical protein
MDQKKEDTSPMYLQICTILHGAPLKEAPTFPPVIEKGGEVVLSPENSKALLPVPT